MSLSVRSETGSLRSPGILLGEASFAPVVDYQSRVRYLVRESAIFTPLGLAKTVALDPRVQVTIVNRENHSLLIPMLHEVGPAISDPHRQSDVNLINGEKSDVESIFDFRSDWGNREQDGQISAGSGR
jgi:hypothetical protein